MKDKVCNTEKEVLPHKIEKNTFKLLKRKRSGLRGTSCIYKKEGIIGD